MYSSSTQVTSRGCSRAYVICVLWRGMLHARAMLSKGKPISFPIADVVLMEWITQARTDCNDTHFQRLLGGVDYYPKDSSTYWTQPFHFNTWWKNNVERKEKTLSLLKDALYEGHDEKLTARYVHDSHSIPDNSRITRALYCKLSILLSTNIKNHSTRVLSLQSPDKRVVQITLPPLMPSHLVAPPLSNSEKYRIIEDCDSYLSNKMSLCLRQLELKKNKTFHSRLQTKELLSQLHTSSSSSSSNTAQPCSAQLMEGNQLTTHATRRTNRRTIIKGSGFELSSSAVVGTRQCVSQRNSRLSDDTSSLSSSEDSDTDSLIDRKPTTTGIQVVIVPSPSLTTEGVVVGSRKRSRGQPQLKSRPLTYSQRSAALFGRKVPRVDSCNSRADHLPEKKSGAVFDHDDWMGDDVSDNHSTSSSYLPESSELHQYQRLFGQEHDPPLVHTIPHKFETAIKLTTSVAADAASSYHPMHLESGVDLLLEEDTLSAFSPTVSMQHDHSLYTNCAVNNVPITALMMQSTDSYDNEDRQISEDLETARELYFLFHTEENDASAAATAATSTAVSSHSSTPTTFLIDPIQTRWGSFNADNGFNGTSSFFFPSEGQYRNPVGLCEDDTFSNTVVDPVQHNNTARTPSFCSSMGDSINSVLCELTMQQQPLQSSQQTSDTEVAVVSGSTSVHSCIESIEPTVGTHLTAQQSISEACSILINRVQSAGAFHQVEGGV